MPLARIDISKDAPAARIKIVTDAIYDAMVALANVPINDRFQIVTRHSPDELIFPADGYLGITYSPDIVFIQVTWVAGRSTDVKKNFYRMVADTIHEKAGIRREDIWITLTGNAREDWSFGNGEMQYAPT